MKYSLAKQVAMNNPDGFTLNINTGNLVTSGYAVAYLETQNSFDNLGLMKAIKHAEANDGIVGGWLNKDNNKYYYDSIKIFQDEQEALDFGKEQKQIAIFNLDKMEEIVL